MLSQKICLNTNTWYVPGIILSKNWIKGGRGRRKKSQKVSGSRKLGQRLACRLTPVWQHLFHSKVPKRVAVKVPKSHINMESSPTSSPLRGLLFSNCDHLGCTRSSKEGTMPAGLLAGRWECHHTSTENLHCSEWAKGLTARELSSLTERAIFLHDSGRWAQEALHTAMQCSSSHFRGQSKTAGFLVSSSSASASLGRCCREGG